MYRVRDWISGVQARQLRPPRICLSARPWKLTVDCTQRSAWEAFCNAHWTALLDLVAKELLHSPTHDVLWIETAEPENLYWILSVAGEHRSDRHAMLVQREVTAEKVEWLLGRRGPDIRDFTRAAFDFLIDDSQLGLPENFPVLCRDSRQRENGFGLLVRIGPEVSWPLVLPVDHWTSYPHPYYRGFSRYRSVDWILSGRTFTGTIRDRMELDRSMQDRAAFLKSSVFIVNHNYAHWEKKARREVETGVVLLREVTEAFREGFVRQGTKDVAANVVFNPSAEQVDLILRDPGSRLVFADFHTDEGRWQACPEKGHLETVDLARYVPTQALRHVALLSASHCCSVSDPTGASGSRSICQTLLDAGVKRTSGSIVSQDARDYLCRLLFMFCDAQALGPVLFQCCLLAGVDFDELVSKVNRFLRSMSFDELDPNVTAD